MFSTFLVPDRLKRLQGAFFPQVAAWSAGLVLLVFIYQAGTGSFTQGSRNAWDAWHLFSVWTGGLLPFASYAGGLALSPRTPFRSVVFRGGVVAALSFCLLGLAAPLTKYQGHASAGSDLEAFFPFGPETPSGLLALRAFVTENPPPRFILSVSRPLDRPPNWLTYLIHGLLSFPAFAVLAVLIGWEIGGLTTGLSPPTRRNLRWTLGLVTGIAFFVASVANGEWVRSDPLNSGVLGAWLPLGVPLVELGLLITLGKRRHTRSLVSVEPGA